ncbi:(-)-germacrene D synthase [Quillaja saponaria]|uniref:(-)-germacrene D synthase n=1 Tax=Quillaja saponaria TaxID=32244 RepID=A0AAD7L0E1_QUISA|nr:(-)-germacrene D synthase [Quillaja saponaria]
MLMVSVEVPLEKLELIDAVQRLGLSYHFENEIDNVLQQMYESENDGDNKEVYNDLYYVALRFRLLRQQGYKASCCVFDEFKDNEGNFRESLITNMRGLLNLYQAAHLRIHGEHVLDEALAFTATHFESMMTQLSPPLAAQVSHALKQPIHKGLPRLEARSYFSFYQEDPLHNEVLLALSKIRFQLIAESAPKGTQWWKDLEFSEKLPFARDRVVECYFWILGVYFEPEYYMARRFLTKVIAMTSIIDDIYDVYGTLEELELFTEAVERWDIGAIYKLPEYMKHAFQALLDVYAEIEEKMISEGRSYRFYYAREAMKNQVRAYFHEAKWFHQQYIPTMDEYMPLALVTCGYSMLATTSLVGMGDIVTKETFEWLLSGPKIVKGSAVVNRLMDDMVSHKFEQKRGHVASAIECYMKQHGVKEEETIIQFQKQVADAWKDMNEECLYPTSVPMPILTRVVNLARVIDVLYKDEDGYTHANVVLKDYVASLLIEPVQI